MNKNIIKVLCILIMFCFVGCSNEQKFSSERTEYTYTSENKTKCSSETVFIDETISYNTEDLPTEIQAFMKYDWTKEEVLMDHDLQPLGSGDGWNFNLCDIDFDGQMEMLVSFPCNYGDNCLYIYKVVDGTVENYADIIATPEYGLYHKSQPNITKYINNNLIDVYKNESGKYKCLTTDDGSISGVSTIKVFEIIFKENSFEIKELAKNEWPYDSAEGEYYVDSFFMGKRLSVEEDLDEKIDEYMKGFSRIEIPIITSDISFPRDIVSYSDSEKQDKLEKLYADFYEKLK